MVKGLKICLLSKKIKVLTNFKRGLSECRFYNDDLYQFIYIALIGVIFMKNKRMKCVFIAFVLLLSFQSIIGQTIRIGTGGDFTNLSAAQSAINPGDTVVILNQIFNNGTQFLNGVNGTPSQPVVIIAQTMHAPIFQGGTEAIHLVNCNYIELNGLTFEQQTANGVNIDDGGDYTTPSTNITVRNCVFRNMGNTGNRDFLKMSGVDSFLIENCSFRSGTGGAGIDFVGCHHGIVQDCVIDSAGIAGIQAKGGCQFITIRRNIIKNIPQRGLNLGGSTGMPYFRPALSNPILNAFEAADLEVYSNVFINNKAPIAYVGCVRVKVINNTFYKPQNWVIRILQETTLTGFLSCADNEFRNNLVYLAADLTEVNIGPNTSPGTFTFTNNLWFNESSSNWTPILPVVDSNQVIGDPLFSNVVAGDYTLQATSPAIGAGISLASPVTDFIQTPYSIPRSIGAYEGNPITVDVPLSTAEQNHVLVYPNPSNGTFTIELGGEEEWLQLIVTDLHGRVIISDEMPKSKSMDLVVEEPSGMYFLTITSKTRKEVIRLVKI